VLFQSIVNILVCSISVIKFDISYRYIDMNSEPKTTALPFIGWNTPLTVLLVFVLSVIYLLPVVWQLLQAAVLVILCGATSYFVETKSWALIKEYGNRTEIGQRIIASIEHAVGIASETKNSVQQNISGWNVPVVSYVKSYFAKEAVKSE
jgi:hypothetical protein